MRAFFICMMKFSNNLAPLVSESIFLRALLMKNLMQKAKRFHQIAQEEVREHPGDMVLIIIGLYVVSIVAIFAAVL